MATTTTTASKPKRSLSRVVIKPAPKPPRPKSPAKPAKNTPRARGILSLSTMSRLNENGNKTHLTEARVRTALWRFAGNLAEAARDCGISRQAMRERVQRNPALQAFMVEIQTATADFVESEIMKAISAGDMATARWFADRKMRDRGYGHFFAHVDETPPDPAQQAQLQKMIAFFHTETERRYREGLPPLLIEAKAVEVKKQD